MPKFKTNECENVHTQLSAYFDNQIPMWKRSLIRRHLNQCPDCASRSAAIQQTDKLLRFVEPVEASDTFLSDVISHATAMKTSQKARQSIFNRLGSRIEGWQVWMRTNIRVYNPVYMCGFIFGVFIMVGATLYSPRIDKLNLFSQFRSKSLEVQKEKFIAFDVILEQEPKRSLKIR